MTEPNEPKKETTRITSAPASGGKPAGANTRSRDTVQLPPREAPFRIASEPPPVSNSAAQGVTSPQFYPPQSPVVPLAGSVMPAPDLPSSGPVKETVRIPLSAVQMKKTQPLGALPEMAPQNPSIAVAPDEKNPMPLLWLLLAVSALILIIQIWTYLS